MPSPDSQISGRFGHALSRRIAVPAVMGLFGVLLGIWLGMLIGDRSPKPNASSAGEPRSRPQSAGVVERSTAREMFSRSLAAKSDTEDETPERALAKLAHELEIERQARQSLEAEIAALRESLSQAGSDEPTKGVVLEAESMPTLSLNNIAPNSEVVRKPWFSREELKGAGLSSSEIVEIERLWEANEMEKLYLDDQARRDGTFRSKSYNDEIARMEAQLRVELGPGGYDAYLFATGKNNRVVVRQVIEDSPAGYAGLEAGDVVISYSENRVFNPYEFKLATTAGDLGTAVSLEVSRNGRLIRLSVPRGPLGVQLAMGRASPIMNW